MQLYASIRRDLYESDLRIIGDRVYRNTYDSRPATPLYWLVESTLGDDDGFVLLRDPFGQGWVFDSIDLDFEELEIGGCG